MKVSVSRDDVVELSKLLEQLKLWESMEKCGREYGNGRVVIFLDKHGKESCVDLLIDRYQISHGNPSKSPSDLADKQIRRELSIAIEKFAARACEIIRENLPVQIE